MKGKISVLSSELANKIAAGEVVERPASVVKELVENAIDAHATSIEIRVLDAGIKSIAVLDNGEGMSPDDLELAFVRHATSKIRSQQDLASIRTLGFRGEALPSIAAVSRLTAKSKPSQQELGMELILEGGEKKGWQKIGMPQGTHLIIEDLFFNTPARLKFLKTRATELAQITQTIESLACIHMGVRFVFYSENRLILQCPAQDRVLDRLRSVYGKALPETMLEQTQTAGPVTLNAIYALPQEFRNNRSGIRLFVNQRAIEHRNLAFALLQAFKPWLPENRFPIVFLYLAVPPAEVDVNVHPMKREVRFQNESGLFEMIKSFFTQILQSSQQALSRAGGDFHPIRASQSAVADPMAVASSRMTDSFWSPKRIQSAMGQYLKRGHELPTMGRVANETVTGYTGSSAQEPSLYSPAPLLGSESFSGEAFHLLGSAGKHYAVFTTADGLYIMDYHAVHERQLYEKLMVAKPERQTLLFPVNLELSSSAYQWFLAFQDDFEQMGFEFSRASGNSLLVSAQPAAIHSLDLQAFLNDLITQLSSEIPLSQTADPISEKLAKTMACHSAVRSGKLPSVLDLQQLVRELLEKPILSTCPHGRPTFLFYAWSDLDKAFKRA